MSEQATEQDDRPAVELPDHGDLAFGALMDALAPEGEKKTGAGAAGAEGAPAVRPDDGAADTGEGGGDRAPAADGGADADGAGAPAAGRAAAGADGQAAGGPGDGVDAGRGPAEGGAEQPAADTGAAAPEGWTVPASEVAPKLADLSSKIEEGVLKAHQQRAFASVKEEHGKYFQALEQHPRLLVGTTVPAIGRDGTETLRSSEDAREWQEAVKSVLMAEINARATTGMEESRSFLETMHASIDLFKNNTDLIPGTKGFDKELADRFAALAGPYEIRVDGKLQGYSIPVQPLIDKLRADRGPKTQKNRTEPARIEQKPADPPQAGIPSKAGSSVEKEDFSTLFGTIGLPHLKI